MKLPQSKRLRFAAACVFFNFVCIGLGVVYGADIQALGVALAMANSPLYVYILGETFRPSTNN